MPEAHPSSAAVAALPDAEPEGPTPRAPWVRRLGRSLAFSLVAFLVLVIVLFLRVRGQIHQSLGPLGAQLDQAGLLDELLDKEQPISGQDRTLVINGQRLSLATERVSAPVEATLTAFLDECPTGSRLGQPVVSGDRGYAICAHPPEGSDASLSSRLGAFRDTSDIGQLGRLEYAYAVESSESGKTSMLRLASSDRFELDELVPTDGDAMGADPSDFPRPPDGPRVLHSFEEGLPYALFVYGRSERSVAELRAWYRANVDDAIWVELDLDAEAERRGVPVDADNSLVFARREDLTRFVLVELKERPVNERRPGRTMVAIAEAR